MFKLACCLFLFVAVTVAFPADETANAQAEGTHEKIQVAAVAPDADSEELDTAEQHWGGGYRRGWGGGWGGYGGGWGRGYGGGWGRGYGGGWGRGGYGGGWGWGK